MKKQTIRETIIDSNNNVSFTYPDNYTQQQRGYTPAVGVSGVFKGYRTGKAKPRRIVSHNEFNTVVRFKRGAISKLSAVLRSLYGLREKFSIRRTTAYKKQERQNRKMQNVLGIKSKP